MRILYALNAFRPLIDGVTISIERQALGLVARGHAVAIVAPGSSFSDYTEVGPGYRIYRLRAISVAGQRRRVSLLPSRAIAAALADFQPDVVVVSAPFLLSRAMRESAHRHGYPVVGITSVMPEWFDYNVGPIRPLGRLFRDGLWRVITAYYNRCDHVVAVTRTALRYLTDHGLRRPASVISNGVPIDRFRPRKRQDELARRLGIPEKPTVLYTGRLDPEKCMDVWMRAVPRVRRMLDAHFVIGGDGVMRRGLERMAERAGIRHAVTFVGFLPDEDYAEIFSLADVFAITSPVELQSVVILEAAASGLPVVGVRAGALPEFIRQGENGCLVAPGDDSALAEALIELLSRPADRLRMGQAARAAALTHDLDHTIDQYERLYSAIARPRPRILAPWSCPRA